MPTGRNRLRPFKYVGRRAGNQVPFVFYAYSQQTADHMALGWGKVRGYKMLRRKTR